jgi:hypothetical protein
MKRILHLAVLILMSDIRVFSGIFYLYLYDEWYIRLIGMEDVNQPYQSYIDRLRCVYDRANNAIIHKTDLP